MMQERCGEIPHHKKGKLMQRLYSCSVHALWYFNIVWRRVVEGICVGKFSGTGCGHFSAVTQSECRINAFWPVHIVVVGKVRSERRWSKDSDFTACSLYTEQMQMQEMPHIEGLLDENN